MKRKLLWLIPLAFLVVLGAAIVALPAYVASTTHRATIEALASSLTGRQVRIGGKVSLGLLPSPELTAQRITITGPDGEVINAKSLTLDISLAPLLRGRISAQNLVLDSPQISLPWPLPGGVAAIAPPPWLAALHGQVQNGELTLGGQKITQVDADIFTGPGGSATLSGTGRFAGQTLSVSLAIGARAAGNAAPVTLDASRGALALHISGTLDEQSALMGKIGVTGDGWTGTAALTADGALARFADLNIVFGKAMVSGEARFDIAKPHLSATLRAKDFNLGLLPPGTLALPPVPVTLSLDLQDFFAGGWQFPMVKADLALSSGGLEIQRLTARLPGDSTLAGHGLLAADGSVQGEAQLDSAHFSPLLAAYGATVPAGWDHVTLDTTLSGTLARLRLDPFAGRIDGHAVDGVIVVAGNHATGALHFDRLDLTKLASWVRRRPAGAFTVDGEITAAQASLGRLELTNLLLDGTVENGVDLRLASARIANGLAGGSLAIDHEGRVSAAHGFLVLPSGAALADLLPTGWTVPDALLKPRLDLEIAARGPANALSTSAAGTLGDFSLSAAPVIDLPARRAAGPVTLRHPSAIAVAKIFGQASPAIKAAFGPPPPGVPAAALQANAAHPTDGVAWPGPGSFSLRADFVDDGSRIGLPDFVLSFGDLTASGQILRADGKIEGEIAAASLAIPPLATGTAPPWGALAGAAGKIGLKAGRVLYAGAPILGPAAGTAQLQPGHLSVRLDRAAFAGGNLTGLLDAAMPANAAPGLSGKFTLDAADAARLQLPFDFPLPVSSGTVAAQASLTASGYTPKVWAATLSGTASLSAKDGTLGGFDLRGAADALLRQSPDALRQALSGGQSAFSSLALGAKLDHGNATLTQAAFSGPDGTASATGNIDLFDQDVALELALRPQVSPPITLQSSLIGGWAAPKQYPQVKAAQAWLPMPPPAPPAPAP